MEVSRPGNPCGCHFRGYSEGATLQRLLSPDRHNSPVLNFRPRSPSTECGRSEGYRRQESKRPETRTLEGVLRGEVLSLFSDLHRSSPQTEDSYDIAHRHVHSLSPAPLPQTVACPRPSTSPVTPYSLKRSYSSSIDQDQPIDLSCKKMRGDTPRPNVHLDISNRDNSFENHSPHQGINSVNMANQKGPSLLRNLLCLGKDLESPPQYLSRSENFIKTFPGNIHIKSENSVDGEHDSHRRSQTISSPSHLPNRLSPANLSGRSSVSSTTRVTLAKKNMLPVSARVSDWLVKIIRFAKSIPEFSSLLHNDKLALLLNSWARLLLLYMAENNFQFVVTPDLLMEQPQMKVQCPENTGNQEEPTMKGVESIQTFIRKCQNMGTDSKEFAFLRMAVLFNAGIRGLDRPDMVDRVNSSVQQLLQQHVQASRPRDFMHYSRLLMSLPALYGINCKMVENLFCRHINGNMDMDVLLKEMLQNI